jgi:hypothetical protein
MSGNHLLARGGREYTNTVEDLCINWLKADRDVLLVLAVLLAAMLLCDAVHQCF